MKENSYMPVLADATRRTLAALNAGYTTQPCPHCGARLSVLAVRAMTERGQTVCAPCTMVAREPWRRQAG